MKKMETLSAIVPFYNEERNLERIPGELLPALDGLGVNWELVLVDDGSSDGSLAVARALTHLCRRSKVVVHPANRGLGAAVRSGIQAATSELVVTLDADLTFHPKDIATLLARFREGGVDIVSGSPALAGFDGVPWYRIALSRGANLLYQLALGRRLTAVTPILRLYRAATLAGLELESEHFDINAEILVKALLAGARVAEVPAVLATRKYGVSKLDNRREIANHLRFLRKILRWRLTASRGPRVLRL